MRQTENDFFVVRQPDYEENVYFVRKQTLIFGLNIVGGRVHDQIEWNRRHTSEINFVTSVSETNILNGNIAGIIIMAHATPKDKHKLFFDPSTIKGNIYIKSIAFE